MAKGSPRSCVWFWGGSIGCSLITAKSPEEFVAECGVFHVSSLPQSFSNYVTTLFANNMLHSILCLQSTISMMSLTLPHHPVPEASSPFWVTNKRGSKDSKGQSRDSHLQAPASPPLHPLLVLSWNLWLPEPCYAQANVTIVQLYSHHLQWVSPAWRDHTFVQPPAQKSLMDSSARSEIDRTGSLGRKRW